MLTPDEKKFLEDWEQKKNSEKSLLREFRFVIPIFLISASAILLNVFTGWYTRATMVANSQSTPLILIIAVIIVAIFTSIFYKRHREEMNEQRFIELTIKKNKESLQEDISIPGLEMEQ